MSDKKKTYIQAKNQGEALQRFIVEFSIFTDELTVELLFCVEDLIKVE